MPKKLQIKYIDQKNPDSVDQHNSRMKAKPTNVSLNFNEKANVSHIETQRKVNVIKTLCCFIHTCLHGWCVRLF